MSCLPTFGIAAPIREAFRAAEKHLLTASLAVLLTACCGGSKPDTVTKTSPPVPAKATPAPTASARPCSAMSSVGDCTACCGTAYRATFRGAGTCTCNKL